MLCTPVHSTGGLYSQFLQAGDTTMPGENEQSSRDSRVGHMRCSETVLLVTSDMSSETDTS